MSPEAPEAHVVLCDFAEVINGKLYIMGGLHLNGSPEAAASFTAVGEAL